MAIDDNTSYELTGAQVKDLASKIKGNTKLAKDLSGGESRTSKLVYMTAITGTDALRIAEEIDPQQASASMVTSLMKYRFYNAETGEEYDNLSDIMDVIDTDLGLIEYVQMPSDNSNYPVVKMVESAAVRADGEDYYLDIILKTFDKASLTIGQEKVTIGADTQFNLYWYKTTVETSTLTRARGYVQRISLYANDIVNEINASLPPDTPAQEYASWAQITNFMEYVFFGENGTMLKTPADIRSLLRAGNNRAAGPLVYVPSRGYQDNNNSISYYDWTGNASTGRGVIVIFSPLDKKEKTFAINAVDPTQYDDGRKHYWYQCSPSDSDADANFAFGYTDPSFFDISTETPENMFQVATDSSDNLYMASGVTSAADWKKINNDAIVAFTGTDGTAAGVAGLVPAPAAADTNKYLKSDGTWATVSSGTTWAGEKVFYGTCSTYYYTSAKAVSTSSDFAYEEGVVLFVKFTNYHTNSSFTLNVNSTGAKTVYTNGSSSSNGDYMWKANDIVGFVYDGTYWRMIDSDRATSSYWGKVKLASSYTASSSDTVPTSSHLYSVYNIANGKQDRLIAGQGISISGNTISATSSGDSYTYSGSVDAANNKFTTTLVEGQDASSAQSVVLNAGSNITFSSSTALGKVGPTIVPNTTAAYYADITSLTFTPTNANLGYFFVLRVYKEYQMATGTNMYQATLYLSNTTYSYSSAAEVSAAINNEQIIVNPDFMAFSNYFTQINQSSFQSDAATAISQISGVPANFGGTIDNFGQATYVDVYVYVLNESAFTISATGGGSGSGIKIIDFDQGATTASQPNLVLKSTLSQTDFDAIADSVDGDTPVLFRYHNQDNDLWYYNVRAISMSLTPQNVAVAYIDVERSTGLSWGSDYTDRFTIAAYEPGTGHTDGEIVLLDKNTDRALIIREWS